MLFKYRTTQNRGREKKKKKEEETFYYRHAHTTRTHLR